MNSLEESISILRTVTNRKPVNYWEKDSTHIFRVENDGSIGCDYYVVDGLKVRPTNPILSKLDLGGMKECKDI